MKIARPCEAKFLGAVSRQPLWWASASLAGCGRRGSGRGCPTVIRRHAPSVSTFPPSSNGFRRYRFPSAASRKSRNIPTILTYGGGSIECDASIHTCPAGIFHCAKSRRPTLGGVHLEQGDVFEVENAAWLRQMLPHYENVWSAFIGHDGLGWPCEISGLDDAAEIDRRRFYQAHYSMARSMRKLADLGEQFEKDSGHVGDYHSFETLTDRLFYYLAYVGHVRDMIAQIDSSLGLNGTLAAPLQEFYDQRNHVLHGPRLPVQFQDGLLMIPPIAVRNEVFGDWSSKATWVSVDPKKFQFVADFVADTTKSLFKLVNELHGKIYDAAMSRFDGRKIIEPEKFHRSSAPISGTLFVPAISAFVPPSGEFFTNRS